MIRRSIIVPFLLLVFLSLPVNAQDGTLQLTQQPVVPGTYGPCLSQVVNSRGVITSIATVPCPNGGGGGGGIGGSGTPGALARWLTPTTLGDSLLSESGNRLFQQNGINPQSFLFAHTYTDATNWDGLLIETNWENLGWVGIFPNKSGNGQYRKLALGTLGAQEVLIYANGSVSAKFHINGSVDFNGNVFVPDFFIGIPGAGAQHRQHFYNNQTPHDLTIEAGVTAQAVAYKLPVNKPTSNGQVLKCDTNGQMYWE